MKNLQGKTAVITGAGSGIGQALAQRLSAHGCNLAICDINETGLAETVSSLHGSGRVEQSKVDVADRGAMQDFASRTIDALGSVDIVINNAGVALEGSFEDNSYEEIEWILGINLWGVIHGCKEFLPHLKRRPEASLVNVSSIFGILAAPDYSAYNITKFGVRGLSEALRQELKDTGVVVTCVHPGGIKTNIMQTARSSAKTGSEWADTQAAFEKNLITSSDSAAKTIIRAIRNKKKKVLVGIDAKVLDRVARAMPTSYERIMGLIADID